MQIQNPNPTPVCPAISAATLRGGAMDGSRDGPPPGGPDRTENEDPSLTLVLDPIMKPAASGQRPAASGQRPAASGQRPAASGQRPAASGQRPAASGQNCDPHSRLDSPRRPDARTGPSLARCLTLLFPVLALLFGALQLLPAGPAAAQVTPATVTLSASPAQVWEGQASRVTATLSHALPHGVLIPVTVTPCPEGSWCKRWNNYGIHIGAGNRGWQPQGPG